MATVVAPPPNGCTASDDDSADPSDAMPCSSDDEHGSDALSDSDSSFCCPDSFVVSPDHDDGDNDDDDGDRATQQSRPMSSDSSIPRTSTDASASALVSLVDGSNAPADSDFPELPALRPLDRSTMLTNIVPALTTTTTRCMTTQQVRIPTTATIHPNR